MPGSRHPDNSFNSFGTKLHATLKKFFGYDISMHEARQEESLVSREDSQHMFPRTAQHISALSIPFACKMPVMGNCPCQKGETNQKKRAIGAQLAWCRSRSSTGQRGLEMER